MYIQLDFILRRWVEMAKENPVLTQGARGNWSIRWWVCRVVVWLIVLLFGNFAEKVPLAAIGRRLVVIGMELIMVRAERFIC